MKESKRDNQVRTVNPNTEPTEVINPAFIIIVIYLSYHKQQPTLLKLQPWAVWFKETS